VQGVILMKLVFIFALLFLLTACSRNTNGTEDFIYDLLTSPRNFEEVAHTPTHEWTIDDLSSIIISAAGFWDDWWALRGPFAWENIDDTAWYYWVEQPDHPRSRGLNRLKPQSGFATLYDISDYLGRFYTQAWIACELFGEGTTLYEPGEIFFGYPYAFEDYDGELYVSTARWGNLRPNWPTASHTLVSQSGNHTTVQTTVVAYDHRASGDEMPMATFNFVFIDGRIESGLGYWTWPDTGEWAGTPAEDPYVPLPYVSLPYDSVPDNIFTTSIGHIAFHIAPADNPILDFFPQQRIDYNGLRAVREGENPQHHGDSLAIWSSDYMFEVELINFTEDLTDGLSFVPVSSFGFIDVVAPGQALVIYNYVGVGTMPWSGITFLLDTGERIHFWMQHDQSDSPNAFQLGRFVPLPPANNRHPLAVVLDEFNARAQGETSAFLARVGTNSVVVAIDTVDGFAEATIFLYTGMAVITKDFGSIEGFPFSLSLTRDNQLVKTT